MGLQRYPVQKFHGLNTKAPPYDLEPGEAQALQNVRYPSLDDSQESLEQRKGFSYACATFAGGVNSNTCGVEHGITAKLDTAQLIVSAGKDLWSAAPVSGGSLNPMSRLYNSALAADTSNQDMAIGNWYFAEVSLPTFTSPKIYCAPAGTDTPQIWDGVAASTTAWTLTGSPVPANNWRSLVYWRGRLVALTTDSNRVFYSNVGDPNTWGNFIDIFDDYGSENVELIVHKNNLYLIKRNSVWMIYDPNNFANRLISNDGCGTLHRHIAVSNFVDQRLYITNLAKGYIYSTNGETDWIIENPNAPMRPANLFANALGFFHTRIAVDPATGSVLVLYGTAAAGDTIDELPVVGRPGQKPVLRHVYPGLAALFSGVEQAAAGAGNQYAVFAGEFANVIDQSLVELYATTTGQDLWYSGAVSNIVSFWESGWMPMISEEPWERIRRVNAMIRGTPSIKVYSSMTGSNAGAAPDLTWNPAGGLAGIDRGFMGTQGPNKRGRYHKVRIENIPVGSWGVSALEFAIRGGKEKK